MNRCADDILESIRKLHASDRYFSSSAMNGTCRTMESLMRGAGMTDVNTFLYPADGKTEYGGWVMPVSWEAEEATLATVAPDGSEEIFRRYSEEPCSLMLNSRPVDLVADAVLPSAPSLDGKIVLNCEHFPRMTEALSWFSRGALGVLSSVLGGNMHGKPGYEYLDDACQWCNYMIPHWLTDGAPFGFSLSPRQGRMLRAKLEAGERVTLHAVVRARIGEGGIPVVTGVLKGRSEEEIVVAGHLFEYGANDNASGPSTALAVIRELAKNGVPERSIRLLCCYEVRSMQAMLNNPPRLDYRRMLAGIDVDMVALTLDRSVTTGGGRPFAPSFPCALFNRFVREEPGYSVRVMKQDFDPMDNLLAEPATGVPFTNCVMITAEPNYHKSCDTPDRLSRENIEASFRILSRFLTFLCNAGADAACQTADIVFEDELGRLSAAPDDRKASLLKQASAALDSVLRLVRSAPPSGRRAAEEHVERKKHELETRFGAFTEPVFPLEHADGKEKLFPVKLFHGIFSFENHLRNPAALPPEIRPLVRTWTVPLWIDLLLFLSDGTRRVDEIYSCVRRECGEIDEKLFLSLLDFLAREGRLALKGEILS